MRSLMGQSGDIKQKSLIECALEAMANRAPEYRKSVDSQEGNGA